MKQRKASGCRPSQVLVEDPTEHLRVIKEALQEKEGIPVEQQRLVFGTEAQQLETFRESTKQQPAAEDLLSSLNHWQAIIFQDGKAIGRSLTLRLYSCEAIDADLCKKGLGVESFSLQLDSWLPSWKAKSDDSSPLYIAVDERFKASRFHIQLIGRTREGKSFALPFTYHFDGAHAYSRLEYFDSYVKRHQQSRQDLLDTPVSSEFSVNFDEGLQGFTAVFDVVDQPHWLKCFVLRFWVLIANKLDQDAPLCSNSVVSLAQGKADSMAPTKLASKSGRDSNDSQYQRKQQAAGGIAHQPSSLSQASERGWLPPALLPPKSDSNGKQKLPKKSMKQRVGQAEDGRESSLPAAAKAQSSPTSDSWTTGETEINGIDCRGAAAMSETSDDGEVSSSRPPMASLSLKALQTNGMANGHSGRHTRNSSRDSQDSDGSMETAVGMRASSQGGPAIADTAVRWSSMNGADGFVQASLVNGHGNGKDHGKQNGSHMTPGISARASKHLEPVRVGLNGILVDEHALNGTSHGWDNASTSSFDPVTGEDTDTTMQYSSIGSDASEGVEISPALLTLPPGAAEASVRASPGAVRPRLRSARQAGKPQQRGTEHDGAVAGQGTAEGPATESQPMSGMSSEATSSLDSPDGMKPSPLVSPERAAASSVEAWIGASAQHLCPPAAWVAVPHAASAGREPRPLQRPTGHLGDPVPPQESPAEMASTIQPGGPLLPVEAPVSRRDPASSAPGQGPSASPGQEPLRSLSMNSSGRRHSWSADDSPAYHHSKQVPASPFASEEPQNRVRQAQSAGHGAASVAQRRDLRGVNRVPAMPGAMRPPVSGSMPVHSMGHAAALPTASSMQGNWQLPPAQLLNVNANFLKELQHRMYLQLQQQQKQQQKQQQRGFAPHSGEQRGPVRTRSLPKLYEQQQQQQWTRNGRIVPGAEHWPSSASHPMMHASMQTFPGASHNGQPAGSSAKQPTVQHIEALSHQAAASSRSRQEQRPAALRAPGHNAQMLHRLGYSLPTTPVAAHQRAHFPGAHVMVRLSEGASVLMGEADAIQLGLAPQHIAKPSSAAVLPAVPAMASMDAGRKHEASDAVQQPPPPPGRSAVIVVQRQGSIQVSPPAAPSPWSQYGEPPTDIERFMSLATPILGSRDPKDLKLADVWNFYDEASIYGKEFFTRGGGRGPSLAYFVPSLSAMQLFLPIHTTAARTTTRQVYRLSDALAAQHPDWPSLMTPLAELFETTKPYDRPALRERVQMLLDSSGADGLPGARLMDQPLCGLHPASWICVAWYPIYRIPDAPLTAKFLTYHSLSPLLTAATHYGMRSLTAGQLPQHADGQLCLPTVGLKLCHLASEEWLDPVPAGASMAGGSFGRASSNSSSCGDAWSSVSTDDESGAAAADRDWAGAAAAVKSGWDSPMARRVQLRMLSENADRLSLRDGVIAQSSAGAKGRHDDYTFFMTRCEEDPLRL